MADRPATAGAGRRAPPNAEGDRRLYPAGVGGAWAGHPPVVTARWLAAGGPGGRPGATRRDPAPRYRSRSASAIWKFPARLAAGSSPRPMARRIVRSWTPMHVAASRAVSGTCPVSIVRSGARSSMVRVASPMLVASARARRGAGTCQAGVSHPLAVGWSLSGPSPARLGSTARAHPVSPLFAATIGIGRPVTAAGYPNPRTS